jgi:hypothetical protein
MQLETKFLRLRMPVTLGSRFGDWHVSWLGGYIPTVGCWEIVASYKGNTLRYVVSVEP